MEKTTIVYACGHKKEISQAFMKIGIGKQWAQGLCPDCQEKELAEIRNQSESMRKELIAETENMEKNKTYEMTYIRPTI